MGCGNTSIFLPSQRVVGKGWGQCLSFAPPMLYAQSHPDSLQVPGLQPARFLHPGDFPGKNTGVGSSRGSS